MKATIQKFKKADQFLILLHERTEIPVTFGSTTPEGMYWVPNKNEEFINETKEWLPVNGGGDRSALNALVRKGLAVFVSSTEGYAITEDGRRQALNLLATF